jgi:hypothetical protein
MSSIRAQAVRFTRSLGPTFSTIIWRVPSIYAVVNDDVDPQATAKTITLRWVCTDMVWTNRDSTAHQLWQWVIRAKDFSDSITATTLNDLCAQAQGRELFWAGEWVPAGGHLRWSGCLPMEGLDQQLYPAPGTQGGPDLIVAAAELPSVRLTWEGTFIVEPVIT